MPILHSFWNHQCFRMKRTVRNVCLYLWTKLMEKPNPLDHIFIWKMCCVSAVDFLECWLANTVFGMQLIHRVGEHYLNFNLLFKMMLNCYFFKGFSGHVGTQCRQWSCSLVSKSNWIDRRQLKQWLLKSLRWMAKKSVILSNLRSVLVWNFCQVYFYFHW